MIASKPFEAIGLQTKVSAGQVLVSYKTVKALLKWLAEYTQAHVGVRHLVGRQLQAAFGTPKGSISRSVTSKIVEKELTAKPAVEANTEESLRTKSVGELRRILDERKVDYSDCLEKSEIIQRVLSTEVAAPTADEEPKTLSL